MSSSLQSHGLQHTRLPCLSLSPGICWNSPPLSQWCYLIIFSSAVAFSFCLQSFPVSGYFSVSQLCIRWPKYCSFSFNISPSSEYSGLISFRIDRFDFLAVQGALKSLLQYHNSKASILWCSAFFLDHLSHCYMTTRKTVALIIPCSSPPTPYLWLHCPRFLYSMLSSSPKYEVEISRNKQFISFNLPSVLRVLMNYLSTWLCRA